MKLGNFGEDDFDEGATEDYDVSLAIDAGDLDGLWLENRGDAPDLSFDGDDWELDGLRVLARTADGNTVIYEIEDAGIDLDAGDDFDPGCSW